HSDQRLVAVDEQGGLSDLLRQPRSWIRKRDIFRRRSVLIQGSKIFPDRTARPFAAGAACPIMIVATGNTVLPVCVRADDARIRSKALSAHQTRVHACLDRRLEHST